MLRWPARWLSFLVFRNYVSAGVRITRRGSGPLSRALPAAAWLIHDCVTGKVMVQPGDLPACASPPGQDHLYLFSLARACGTCTWESPTIRTLRSPWNVGSSTQLNLPLTSFLVPKPNLSCLKLRTLLLVLFATGSRLSPAPLQHLFKCLRMAVSPAVGSSTGSATRLSILPPRLWFLVILRPAVRTLSSASLPFPVQPMSTGPPQGRTALPDGKQFPSFPQNRETAIRFGMRVVLCLGGPR